MCIIYLNKVKKQMKGEKLKTGKKGVGKKHSAFKTSEMFYLSKFVCLEN